MGFQLKSWIINNLPVVVYAKNFICFPSMKFVNVLGGSCPRVCIASRTTPAHMASKILKGGEGHRRERVRTISDILILHVYTINTGG